MGHEDNAAVTWITYLNVETVITVASVDRIRCPETEHLVSNFKGYYELGFSPRIY